MSGKEGAFPVADGAYSGGANLQTAASHNLKLVIANFTGCKPDEIYADFKFSGDGHFLLAYIHGCTPEDVFMTLEIIALLPVSRMRNVVHARIKTGVILAFWKHGFVKKYSGKL